MAESAHGVAPDGMKKRDEDSDDGMEFSPFWGIEKGAVLQEARCFNESQLDARRCQQVITKLLYLLNQGVTFTKVRARRDDRALGHKTRVESHRSRSRVPRTRFFRENSRSAVRLPPTPDLPPATNLDSRLHADGSHGGVLLRDEAVPVQGQQLAAHGVPDHQGDLPDGG
jgi:hypothetical protein